MSTTIHPTTSAPVVNTAITTPSQAWASAQLDLAVMAIESGDAKFPELTQLKKRAIEAVFVPALGKQAKP